MSTTIRPLAALNDEATAILMRELGIVDTIRFLNQFRTGTGDYTKERGRSLDDLWHDQIVSGINAKREKPRGIWISRNSRVKRVFFRQAFWDQ